MKSREGRPVKIEGNPQHPASLGASDAFMQAALLGLYDPDRSQVSERGTDRDVDGPLRRSSTRLQSLGPEGSGLHVLTGAVTSPTLTARCAT